jgi:hypothetical protein
MHNRRMALEFTTSYLKDSIDLMRYYKHLGEQAMRQIPDEALTIALDPESNSIGVIVRHLSGNMRSRWTDFLTSDGEKPGRDRDSEFQPQSMTRAEVLSAWEEGWKIAFAALGELTDADLNRTIRIRTEAHSVMQAIHRQVAHYAYHIGQMVFIAKHLSGERWKSLTIPRGKSAEFNARVGAGELSQR